MNRRSPREYGRAFSRLRAELDFPCPRPNTLLECCESVERFGAADDLAWEDLERLHAVETAGYAVNCLSGWPRGMVADECKQARLVKTFRGETWGTTGVLH